MQNKITLFDIFPFNMLQLNEHYTGIHLQIQAVVHILMSPTCNRYVKVCSHSHLAGQVKHLDKNNACYKNIFASFNKLCLFDQSLHNKS